MSSRSRAEKDYADLRSQAQEVQHEKMLERLAERIFGEQSEPKEAEVKISAEQLMALKANAEKLFPELVKLIMEQTDALAIQGSDQSWALTHQIVRDLVFMTGMALVDEAVEKLDSNEPLVKPEPEPVPEWKVPVAAHEQVALLTAQQSSGAERRAPQPTGSLSESIIASPTIQSLVNRAGGVSEHKGDRSE